MTTWLKKVRNSIVVSLDNVELEFRSNSGPAAAAKVTCDLAKKYRCDVWMTLHGTRVHANVQTEPKELVLDWEKEHKRK